MINVNTFKPGITFKFNENIFLVLESSHSKQGRGQANVKAKVKNLRTGSITTLTFTGGEKVSKAHISTVKMQYLYSDGENYIFMDQTSFEQIEIPTKSLEWESNFLVEEKMANVIKFEEEVLGVLLPTKENMLIAETSPAVSGDTIGKATKEATLSTGFIIQVPLFINTSDLVEINTSNGKYLSRVKKHK